MQLLLEWAPPDGHDVRMDLSVMIAKDPSVLNPLQNVCAGLALQDGNAVMPQHQHQPQQAQLMTQAALLKETLLKSIVTSAQNGAEEISNGSIEAWLV